MDAKRGIYNLKILTTYILKTYRDTQCKDKSYIEYLIIYHNQIEIIEYLNKYYINMYI